MDAAEIQAAFGDVLDQAVVLHSYADYDIFIYTTADPRSGIQPEHIRYRFKHCVKAAVTTAVRAEVWRRSLDDRLIDFEQGRDLDGYVWGVACQFLYPGMSLVEDSTEAQQWSKTLGIPFHRASVSTNGHDLDLIFSDLIVDKLDPGCAPFVVPIGAPTPSSRSHRRREAPLAGPWDTRLPGPRGQRVMIGSLPDQRAQG